MPYAFHTFKCLGSQIQGSSIMKAANASWLVLKASPFHPRPVPRSYDPYIRARWIWDSTSCQNAVEILLRTYSLRRCFVLMPAIWDW
jgi:hypothetical protein